MSSVKVGATALDDLRLFGTAHRRLLHRQREQASVDGCPALSEVVQLESLTRGHPRARFRSLSRRDCTPGPDFSGSSSRDSTSPASPPPRAQKRFRSCSCRPGVRRARVHRRAGEVPGSDRAPPRAALRIGSSSSSGSRAAVPRSFWRGSQLPVRGQDLLHHGSTQATDQLVLQIPFAHVEAESFHLRAAEIDTKAGALKSTPELALFPASQRPPARRQSHAGRRDSGTGRPPARPDRQNGNAFAPQIPATSERKRLQRDLVTHSLNQHDCTPPPDPRSLTTANRRRPRRPAAQQGGISASRSGEPRRSSTEPCRTSRPRTRSARNPSTSADRATLVAAFHATQRCPAGCSSSSLEHAIGVSARTVATTCSEHQ